MHYTEVPKVSQFSREPFPHHWERYQKLDGTSVAAEYVLQLFHRYHFFLRSFLYITSRHSQDEEVLQAHLVGHHLRQRHLLHLLQDAV